jgi:hypothetical protein
VSSFTVPEREAPTTWPHNMAVPASPDISSILIVIMNKSSMALISIDYMVIYEGLSTLTVTKSPSSG